MMMTIHKRPATQLMRLKQLGAMHQCRLSFMRQLTRRMAHEKWQFSRPIFDINARGEGVAVYTVHGKTHAYSLIAFAHDLPPEKRSDRVIADAWDATFTLFDGIPTQGDIERLSKNVPLQEAGRLSEKEISLSRANRSVRLWDYILECLANGEQPDQNKVDEVGYLMRTTAVYGSGKFGAADRTRIACREEMQAPFQAEMLSVYLTRVFIRDLINYLAQIKGGKHAVSLSNEIAQSLGIGNSTGLGMAPFLVNHPVLLHNWVNAREKALTRVRRLENANINEIELFLALFNKNKAMVLKWNSSHPYQQEKLKNLSEDIIKIENKLTQDFLNRPYPWQKAFEWGEACLSEEGQEWLFSLILEPYGHLIDDLYLNMADADEKAGLDGSMSIQSLRHLIKEKFGWTLSIDWDDPHEKARIWYISSQKLEPRLGERFEEDLENYEQPLAIGYDAARLYSEMSSWEGDGYIADFVEQFPAYRRIIQRIQNNYCKTYSEIQDNIISKSFMPIDMLRLKLAFFGATSFDPRSDRWLRITMYKHAPYPEYLDKDNADFWVYGG